ncbi:DUF805 domain-containing protein [Cyclobacterium plantarum]|uniref:DUF805 domain-containing protein n=1 Tax=Cyclobacterium plantarum TaxID=2716263 RepID=A0ABX0HES3_9BACT|nr:DUF805 domain-containing protein [Cyclobacterium plantarum]NHE59453.1 DUF805 domain-containing protein [Cyclobacterium plantarum]
MNPQPQPFDYYLDVLKNKYAQFDGRARRSEYWYFVLFNVLVSIGIGIVGTFLDSNFLSMIYSLGVFIPGIAVAVRRLHDTGRSGLWILIGLIPIIGLIVLIVFMVEDSKPDNQYGPNPKIAVQ